MSSNYPPPIQNAELSLIMEKVNDIRNLDDRENQYKCLDAVYRSTDWQSMSIDAIMAHPILPQINHYHTNMNKAHYKAKMEALRTWLEWSRNCQIVRKKPKIFKGYRGVHMDDLPGKVSLDLGIEIAHNDVVIQFNHEQDLLTPEFDHSGDEVILTGHACRFPQKLKDRKDNWYMDGLYCQIVWAANKDRLNKLNDEALKVRGEVLSKRQEYHAEFMAKNKGHKSVTKQLAKFIHDNQMSDIEPEAFVTILNWLAKYENLARPLSRWASTHHTAVQLMTPENVEEAIKLAQIQGIQEA
jgi:hypothetical protein